MKLNQLSATTLCLLFVTGSPAMAGGALRHLSCKARTTNLDLTLRHGEPETILGPTKVVFERLNKLRYDLTLKGDTTFSSGPDLKLAGFIPKLPSAPKAPEKPPAAGGQEAAGTERETDDAENELAAASRQSDVIRDRMATLLEQAQTSHEHLQRRLDLLASLVRQSDSILETTNGPEKLAGDIRLMREAVEKDLAEWKWPSNTEINRLRSDIDSNQKRLQSEVVISWISSQGKTEFLAYDQIRTDLQHLSDTLKEIEPGGQQRKNYEDLRTSLEKWLPVLRSLNSVDDFKQEASVSCGHPFFKNKIVTFELSRRDRTVTDETKALTKEKVITVECPSVASVTGGVGISGLDDRGIKFVSSRGADNKTINTFGYEDKGSEQVNPMMLISTRVTDCPQYNWHATVGTVFDIDNPESNVALGYVLGVTLSLRDTLFLTGGVQFGRVYRLAGGFEIGQEVPEGLAAPPLEREWDQAVVLSASFKIN